MDDPTTGLIEADPAALVRAAQRWQTQYDDLSAAASQLAQASTGGFTAAVSGSALQVLAHWGRDVSDLATACADHASGLRRTEVELAEADHSTGLRLLAIIAAVEANR